jgi:hypothetical protein
MTALALHVCAAIGVAQPRQPAFLEDPRPSPSVETLHLQARAGQPVRIAPDGRAVVTVSIVPKATMHVYAADAEGFVALSLETAPRSLVVPGKVTYPVSETYVFPPTGETSRVYTKPFKVTQAFTLTASARRTLAEKGEVSAMALLRYQACDDRVCYRPATAEVSFDVVKD